MENEHDNWWETVASTRAERLLRTFRVAVFCSAATLCIAAILRLTPAALAAYFIAVVLTCAILLFTVAIGCVAWRHGAQQMLRPHELPPILLAVALASAIGCIWALHDIFELASSTRNLLEAATAPSHWTPG